MFTASVVWGGKAPAGRVAEAGRGEVVTLKSTGSQAFWIVNPLGGVEDRGTFRWRLGRRRRPVAGEVEDVVADHREVVLPNGTAGWSGGGTGACGSGSTSTSVAGGGGVAVGTMAFCERGTRPFAVTGRGQDRRRGWLQLPEVWVGAIVGPVVGEDDVPAGVVPRGLRCGLGEPLERAAQVEDAGVVVAAPVSGDVRVLASSMKKRGVAVAFPPGSLRRNE